MNDIPLNLNNSVIPYDLFVHSLSLHWICSSCTIYPFKLILHKTLVGPRPRDQEPLISQSGCGAAINLIHFRTQDAPLLEKKCTRMEEAKEPQHRGGNLIEELSSEIIT